MTDISASTVAETKTQNILAPYAAETFDDLPDFSSLDDSRFKLEKSARAQNMV